MRWFANVPHGLRTGSFDNAPMPGREVAPGLSAAMLLSGFLFPFAGMPQWAQWVGEALPLTHFVRIVRAIMLKGASLSVLHFDAAALVVLMLVAMTIAVLRFRRTLD